MHVVETNATLLFVCIMAAIVWWLYIVFCTGTPSEMIQGRKACFRLLKLPLSCRSDLKWGAVVTAGRGELSMRIIIGNWFKGLLK